MLIDKLFCIPYSYDKRFLRFYAFRNRLQDLKLKIKIKVNKKKKNKINKKTQ